ncbi:hypothetical protein MUBE_08235 [Mycobacterium uberis]|uniref:Uncharacterized protein n=1 Tax=Mycobacterium uberis TaxID=2162698 RepID=A0A3E1HGF7_9MYCO|nr:hypothetical protein MUBE_08235 [Mycobacterium uberis]
MLRDALGTWSAFRLLGSSGFSHYYPATGQGRGLHDLSCLLIRQYLLSITYIAYEGTSRHRLPSEQISRVSKSEQLHVKVLYDTAILQTIFIN